ncbi:MAG: tRNA 2-thiouridine(34) synthase MnmA [Patescibacteria group bacterium]|nr:tRNA 2-thiouridine(34) synthase MnmA [Patescibacteria group bacterium]
MKKRKKVFLALSGGRDSAVAGYLLRKSGYEVTAVFFKLFKGQEKIKLVRAKKTAKKLQIPFMVWDFKKEFKKRVIQDFVKQYKLGLTPNPCIVCNHLIKFGLFYRKAKEMKADFIATGHYVQRAKIKNKFYLKKAHDKEKDQSYFLWRLKPQFIKNCLFPLGKVKSKRVSKIAKKQKFISKDYKSSQEICFVPGFLNEFLKNKIKTKKGKILEKGSREFLGDHQGVFLYTLGQRTGLGLSGGPWYVVDKNVKKNIIFVTRDKSDLLQKRVNLKLVNIIKKINLPTSVVAKPRYRHRGSLANFKKNKGKYIIQFKKSQRALTPGQSVAIYKNNFLIGGGIIKK